MQKTLPFAIAVVLVTTYAASTWPSSLGAHEAEGRVWVLDPFSYGSTANYEGTLSFELSVGRLESTMNSVGLSEQSVPFHYGFPDVPVTVLVNMSTGLSIATITECLALDDDGCEPWIERSWLREGIPAAFGATAIQGRTITLGTTWTLEKCRSCLTSTKFEVELPNSGSPQGTDFRVVITSSYPGARTSVLDPQGTIHMNQSIPFPLRVEFPNHTIDLVSWSSTQDHLDIGANSPDPLRPQLSLSPFEERRPPEGIPISPHPSWREAQTATSFSTNDSMTTLRYRFSSTYLRALTLRADSDIEREFTSSFEDANGESTTITFTSHQIPLAESLGVPRQWAAFERSDGLTGTAPCVSEAVPIWEGIRFVDTLDLTHGFRGYFIKSDSCDLDLYVYGKHRGFSTETVIIDATTGHLRRSFEWRGDPSELR